VCLIHLEEFHLLTNESNAFKYFDQLNTAQRLRLIINQAYVLAKKQLPKNATDLFAFNSPTTAQMEILKGYLPPEVIADVAPI